MNKNDSQISISSLGEDFQTGKCWTHYKGGLYHIVTLAVKEDTGEILVVYKSLSNGFVWARSLDIWNSTVELDGKNVPRFKLGINNV